MSGVVAALAGAAAAGLKPLSVSVDTNPVTGVWDGEFGVGVAGPVNATPNGGLGPYTISWTRLTGFSFTLVPNSIEFTVSFSFDGPSHQEATYRATVTDSLGQTAFTDVTVIAN